MLLADFIISQCDVTTSERISASNLFIAYRKWMKSRPEVLPFTRRRFTSHAIRFLSRFGIRYGTHRINGKVSRGFVGLSLNPQREIPAHIPLGQAGCIAGVPSGVIRNWIEDGRLVGNAYPAFNTTMVPIKGLYDSIGLPGDRLEMARVAASLLPDETAALLRLACLSPAKEWSDRITEVLIRLDKPSPAKQLLEALI